MFIISYFIGDYICKTIVLFFNLKYNVHDLFQIII